MSSLLKHSLSLCFFPSQVGASLTSLSSSLFLHCPLPPSCGCPGPWVSPTAGPLTLSWSHLANAPILLCRPGLRRAERKIRSNWREREGSHVTGDGGWGRGWTDMTGSTALGAAKMYAYSIRKEIILELKAYKHKIEASCFASHHLSSDSLM